MSLFRFISLENSIIIQSRVGTTYIMYTAILVLYGCYGNTFHLYTICKFNKSYYSIVILLKTMQIST